jgi:peptidoglycan/LPS O-acetylase OafA/YrhL
MPSVSAPPTHASFLSCKYFSSLDLFRFLAIVGVIWHHTQEGFWWFPASDRGFLGVDFFFVISGFLIVTLLLRERDRNGGISLRQFYLRRSLRIFPIYYAMLGVLTLFFLFIRPQSISARPFFEALPYQASYLSNFWATNTILFFTWSLATEEQFYLVWPPVEKWLRGVAVPVLLGVIAANQAINLGLLDGVIGGRVPELNILQVTFTPICFGVLLAHVLHDERGFDRVSSWLGGRPWTSLVLAGLVVLACNNPLPDIRGWPRLLIQVVMTLLLASCVIREDDWLNRLLGVPAVRRIGVISYGMYLYHQFAAHAARLMVGGEKAAPPFSFFLITLALTCVAAELSFRFYETPFLRLKDRLGHAAARRKAKAAEAARPA